MAKNEYQVDLNNMRLFVSVVQAGSLTKAAELLNIPKSHLSRHLTELETSLGTRLMDRGRQGIRLNALGQRFLHNAQEMLSMAQLWWIIHKNRRDCCEFRCRQKLSGDC